MSKRTLFAFFALTAIAAAQAWVNTAPGAFVDISTTGGTALLAASDDSEHQITTTIGNALFPAGNVRIGNNGAVAAGVTTGDIGFTNAAIPVGNGIPAGFPAGTTHALLPFWDDLYPVAANTNTTIWWQESGGVLYIMWKDDGHITAVAGQVITFEIQVFAQVGCAGTSQVQFLYPDSVFGGTHAAFDNALSATIGLCGTAATGLTNAQWSFNTASIVSGDVLTCTANINSNAYIFNITSPLGAGSVQIDIADCAGTSTGYFIPYTFAAGVYPNGWLYGLDITIPDAINIWNAGYPFVGPLPQQIGPVTGLPSGVQFWMVAIGLNGSNTPTGRFSRKTYVIP